MRKGTKKDVKNAIKPDERRRSGGRTSRYGGRQDEGITVRGEEQFAVLARRLKGAGADLRKDVLNEVRAATKPLIAETRKTARATLPSTGGLAERVAKAPQRVTVRTGVNTAGVRVTVAGKKSGAASADKGRVRHPTFGRPNSWVTQDVEPGWFSQTIEDKAPAVRKDVEQVVEDALDKLARRL